MLTTCALALSLLFAVIALSRRLCAVDQRIPPWGARHLLQGPLEGSKLLSQIVIRKLDGSWGSVGGESERPLLLVFMTRACDACWGLASHLGTLERYWRGKVDLLVVFNHPPGESYDELSDLGLSALSTTSSPFLFDIWGIRGVPFAVLLDKNGVVHSKGLVNNLEHLEYLVDLESPSELVPYVIAPQESDVAQAAARD
jgi:hypothetical protein